MPDAMHPASAAVRATWVERCRVWWPIVLGLLLGLVGGQLVTAASTPVHVSSTELMVTARDGATASTAYVGGLFTDQRIASYLQLVDTAGVAASVTADLGTPVLAGSVSAEVLPSTTILRITARDRSPERARSVAGAVGRALVSAITALETPDGGGSAVDVTVVETATAAVRVAPDPARDSAAGLLLGGLFGAGAVVGLGRRRRRTLRGPRDVGTVTGAPTVFVVRGPPEVDDAAFVPLDGRGAGLLLARAVSAGTGGADRGVVARVLVVVSVPPGERPTIALTVADELAGTGRRVLLVGADPSSVPGSRRPGVFDVVPDAVPGPGEDPGVDAVDPVAGLRTRYDDVVVALPSAEPGLRSSPWWGVADGCVLVVRHGVTTTAALARSCDAAAADGIAVRAVVLDRVPTAAAVAQGRVHPYPADPGRRRTAGHHGKRSSASRAAARSRSVPSESR